MAEFYMQCEEEDLTPCQNTAELNQTEDVNSAAENGLVSVSPAPPDGSTTVSPALTVQSPAIGQTKTAVISVAPAPVVVKQLLPPVLQNVQIAAAGAAGQPIYITSQAPPGTAQNLTNPVSYILPAAGGQSVTFLTPAQAGQIITSQLASSSGTPQAVASGKYTTVQIPVKLTIKGPAGIQNFNAVASTGMPAVPLSTVNIATPFPTASPDAAVKVINPTVPPKVVTVPVAVPSNTVPTAKSTDTVPAPVPASVSTNMAPETVPTQSTSHIPVQDPPAQSSTPKAQSATQCATAVTQVFQGASRPPKTCSVCGCYYKAVQSLRGYLCRCNEELIKSVQVLSVQSKKRKPKRVSHKSPVGASSSSSSGSARHPSAASSASAALKHITTSAIPEGDPSPGTGDYDQHGKLIMLVDDFYYGKNPGQPVLIENNQVPIIMKCQLCDKRLKNNIKLMNHMRHHIEMERQNGDGDSHNECPHCFRSFSTPFTLQCHVETVHSQVESTALCKICELSFENLPLFLNHMKNFHKPGEMPYICQVCKFRSSFYQDVIVHFRELHKDTNNLQCPYCLKVFKTSNSYQLHYSKHQKKSVLHCDKCRLHFLYAKDRTEHKTLYHRTHLKPVQLLGLKPGTKVTIRAYITRVDEDMQSQSLPLGGVCPTAESQCVGQNIAPTKRKHVESMLEIMTKFQSQYETQGEPAKKRFCMECNYEIPDFISHFPTFVHCSLCRYRTCCSRAYANHMISYHVSRKPTTKYLNLYVPSPKLGQLSCYSCDYITDVGDLMATHLVAHPDHRFSHCQFSEGFSRGYKRFVFIPTDLIQPVQRLNTRANVMPVNQHSLSNSSKPATHLNQVSSAHTPSIPIQVQPVDQSTVPDENCGTEPNSFPQNRELFTENKMAGSITLTQLKIVLYALCFGVPQAANHFDTQPEEVQSFLLKRQLQIGPPVSREGLIPRASDRLAEWVLCQREQQIPIHERNLFSEASEIMRKDGGPGISYEWAVDFLLRHNLGLQACATSSQLLPPKAQEHVHSFTNLMNKHISSQGFGQSAIGAMDELSIFIDMEQLDPTSADLSSMMSAFRLVGETDPLMDVVFAGLADGTMLPTMVFLKGELIRPDAASLPDIIIFEAKPEGFSDEERLQLWFDKVWRQHVEPGSGGKGLLILDTYRGHMSNDFLASLNSANTLPGIVPCACSCRLQPLEACVGAVLREFLQARWSQHVTHAPRDLIGAEPGDLALLLSAWIVEMLDVLAGKPELLQRSFDYVLNSSPDKEPKGLYKLMHHLTETLLAKEAGEAEFGEKSSTAGITSPSPLPSPALNTQALKNIFEKESDAESFKGFEDA